MYLDTKLLHEVLTCNLFRFIMGSTIFWFVSLCQRLYQGRLSPLWESDPTFFSLRVEFCINPSLLHVPLQTISVSVSMFPKTTRSTYHQKVTHGFGKGYSANDTFRGSPSSKDKSTRRWWEFLYLPSDVGDNYCS